MSKRALLWILAGTALSVAYMIAAGVNADVGSDSTCVGLGSLPRWFDNLCRPALVPRALIIGIGLIPTLVLIYFAEKAAAPGSSAISSLLKFANPTSDELVLEYHEVEWSSDNSRYHCADCGFETADEEEAETHRWQEVGNTPAAEATPS